MATVSWLVFSKTHPKTTCLTRGSWKISRLGWCLPGPRVSFKGPYFSKEPKLWD